MENDRKGFFARLFGSNSSPTEVREGSVDSTGGDSPLTGVLPPARPSYTNVSVDAALGVAAVYRAVSLLGSSVSQLSLGVWRNGAEIEIVAANSNALIRQPNFDISRSAFLEETTVSLATSGNAYWRLYRRDAEDSGPVEELEVLNPHNILIEYDKNGKKTYRYSGYTSGPKTFKDYQVKHLSLLRVPGSLYGLGPIQAAQAELRGSLELRDYANNIFSEDAMPNAILKTDQTLPPGAAEQYKEAFYAQMNGKRGIVVLGNGLSYSTVYLNPVDAQFLENQQFSITQIARMFGVPANKLLAEVNGNSMTYTNMESANTDYVRDTLMSYLREIEEAFSDLIPRGQTVKFKVEELLRADTKTRYEAYKVAIDAGFLTKNEVRLKEGLAPVAGGDSIQTKETLSNNGV